MRYSQERKEAVLKKMLPPHSRSIPELAEEEGIWAGTLYLWRKQARAEGRLLPDGDRVLRAGARRTVCGGAGDGLV
jgi:transposase-like protein